MKKTIFALLLCSSSFAFANSACDTPRDDFDDLYCLNKVYLEADKELNENYKKLNSKLDNEGKKNPKVKPADMDEGQKQQLLKTRIKRFLC